MADAKSVLLSKLSESGSTSGSTSSSGSVGAASASVTNDTSYASPALSQCLEHVDDLLAEYFPSSVNFLGRSEYHILEKKMKRRDGHTNRMVEIPAWSYRSAPAGARLAAEIAEAAEAQAAKKAKAAAASTSTVSTNDLLLELTRQTGLPLMTSQNVPGGPDSTSSSSSSSSSSAETAGRSAKRAKYGSNLLGKILGSSDDNDTSISEQLE